MRLNILSASNSEKEFWLASAEKVIALLNGLDIDYVLINYLDIPNTNMRDLDILVENNEDRAKLLSVLEEEGYVACRYSPISFFSDNKLTYNAPETKLEIDIYPKLAWSWWKIPYLPKGLVTSKKVKIVFGGEYAYVPSHTFDLYVTIVHSHAHSRIALAEVAYVTKLILNFNYVIDWHYLLFLSKKHGVEHTLYVHLFLVNEVMKNLNKNFQNIQNVMDELSKSCMSRLLLRKLQKSLYRSHFPLQYPYLTRFLSIPNEHARQRLFYERSLSQLQYSIATRTSSGVCSL